MATVAWLSIAPVKGMALVDVDSIELTPSGVEGNRRLYLVDEAGRFYAGIQNGRLVQIRAEMSDGRLALRFPDGSAVDDEIRLGDEVTTLFYGRPERGRVVVGPWADAVSHFAGRPLRLVRSEHPAGGVDRDQGPVTMVSQASLDELAKRSGVERVDGRRFRMLVGLDGCEPHEEDEWVGREVALGDAVVRPLEPVARCAITTHDPDTGVPSFDTLREIRRYRGPRAADGRSIDFGVFGAVVRPGRVTVGDTVRPL